MSRMAWILAIVIGLALGGAWYFTRHAHDHSPQPPPASASAPSASAPTADTSAATALEFDRTPGESARVEQWIADVDSGDAARRAAAIGALSRAPRERALPALHRVLTNGEPTVDRPLALRSLRELALHQGDADGAVRAAFREVIYHDGQDEKLLADVQDALDVVEESEMR